MAMKVVCCVCGAYMRGDPDGKLASHGMCEACGRPALAEARTAAANAAAEREPERFIDQALKAHERATGTRRICAGCAATLPVGWSAVYCSTNCALEDA